MKRETRVSCGAAALPAERRVLARRGWTGEKAAFLSILQECAGTNLPGQCEVTLPPATIRNSEWPCFSFRLFSHREYDAESSFAAQHAIVGGCGLFEREGLNHGANAGERTEVERVF